MKKISILSVFVLMSLLLFSCNKEYVDYMDTFDGYEETIGSLSNNESLSDLVNIYGDTTATNVQILPVEHSDDYIIGVDVSSVIAVEEAGGIYYNDQGQEQDVFEIFKDYGVNYVRIRLWNEPYTETGDYYGGGNNDIETAIKIAKRAARVGMRIALDFHYSDFWADPSKQAVPRAWADHDYDQLVDDIYDYTYDTLLRFEEEGVRPHMVQIGNEINNGFVWPEGAMSKGSSKVAGLIQSGIEAVDEVSTEIIKVVHLAEGASLSSVSYFFNKLIENDVTNFDVIGLSYYSFWHGSMAEFEETLQALDEQFDYDIAVMEYSYGFTDLSTENASNIYNSELEAAGGYKTSMQGQASYIRDVNYAVASIDSGIGSFYWEPAWLPVSGAGWAEEGARDYLIDQGDDVSSLGQVSWANQALFSYSGKVLPSMKAFRDMRTSTYNNESIVEYTSEFNAVVNLATNDGLPNYTYAKTSLDRVTKVAVTWNQVDIAAMTGEGSYIIHGTIESAGTTYDVVCYVTAYVNYIINPSFEDNIVTSDINDFSKIEAWHVTTDMTGSVKVESKNPRKENNDGSNNVNIWSSSAYSFRMYQTVTLEAGTYQLSVWARSATDNAGFPTVELIVEQDGTMLETSAITYGTSWSTWVETILVFTVTESKTIIVGIEGTGEASSWAHFDDFALQIVE